MLSLREMECIRMKPLTDSQQRWLTVRRYVLGEAQVRAGARSLRLCSEDQGAHPARPDAPCRSSRGRDVAVQLVVETRFETLLWMQEGVCSGNTSLFFPPPGERPEAREVRESKARALCYSCPALEPCRSWARENREYGFWGGESEEERAAAGYRVDMPVGRVARYPRGEGKPVTPRAARIA
jgi:WhiB family transcriptional regulator, redox-sensing transcriptional regulator